MRTITFDALGNGKPASSDPWDGVPNGAIASAVALLAEAHFLSQDADCDTWDFAVEIHELDALGVSRAGIRWLLVHGLIQHEHETTKSGATRRDFSTSAGTMLNRTSCFVITEAGLALGGWIDDMGSASGRPQERRRSNPHFAWNTLCGRSSRSGNKMPYFDISRAELHLAGQIVKRFRRPAHNQQAILQAFEESCWPVRIDDPLSPDGEICAKRRLNQTIKALNSHQLAPVLRFSGDGSGEGVLWSLIR